MQPTYKYTIGNKQSTMENSSNWFYCPPIFLQFLKCYNRKLSCSRGVTHAFSLSVSLSDISPTSFSSTSDILPHLPISPPPPFIVTFLVLIFTIVLLPAKFLGIFFSTLSVSYLPLSWNFDFLGGVCIVQAISYAFNVIEVRWEPLINAEEKSSIFLSV